MSSNISAIVSEGDVEREPIKVYGTGPEVLRLGNGGAGHTGLLEVLCNAYLAERGGTASIAWIHNHSRNTQLALLKGYVDIALTYERDQENLAQSEGWSYTVGCAFHDHFVIIGPAHDPLGLRHLDNIEQALKLLAKAGKAGEKEAVWFARIDGSATMWKERSLWENVGLRPWDSPTVDIHAIHQGSTWYRKSLYGPADALVAADKAGAYAITDRSTLMRQTAQQTVNNLTVLSEPKTTDDILLNTCYALIPTKPRSIDVETESARFLAFMTGETGQKVVAEFGKSEAGFSFFAPAQDGCARTYLQGGRPVNVPTSCLYSRFMDMFSAGLDHQEDNGQTYQNCVRVTKEDRLFTNAAQMATQEKQPHFASHHEEFQTVLGKRFQITSALKEPTLVPYFHEACVYVPSRDSVFVTSNQYEVRKYGGKPNKTILISELSRDATTDTWTRNAITAPITMPNGGVNYPTDGIIFCQQGGLTTTDSPAALVQMSTAPPYKTKILIDNYHGRPFNSPNDVVVHPSTGTIWFTDPGYGFAQGIRPVPRLPNQVYCFDPNAGTVRAVADGFDMPNGLAFSPSATTLYVTDTGRIRGDGTIDDTRPSTIYSFDVYPAKDNKILHLKNRALFAFVDEGAPDGIKCDTSGNVYAGCGDGVQVWNSSGLLLGKIAVPGGVANFCFGKTGELFLCGETAFYVVNLSSGVEGALLKGLGIRTDVQKADVGDKSKDPKRVLAID